MKKKIEDYPHCHHKFEEVICAYNDQQGRTHNTKIVCCVKCGVQPKDDEIEMWLEILSKVQFCSSAYSSEQMAKKLFYFFKISRK